MAKLGLQPKSRNFKPFGLTEKIRSLWRKPDATGSLAALLAFVCRTIGTGVSDVKLLPTAQADTFVEALKSMLDRAKRQAQFKGPRHVPALSICHHRCCKSRRAWWVYQPPGHWFRNEVSCECTSNTRARNRRLS